MPSTEHRERRLIEQAIMALKLDLTDLVVLTEAASGHYRLTPLIAAMAGAKCVYTLSRDSRFGSARDATNGVQEIAGRWGVLDRVSALRYRADPRLAEADIVTNLGFVRPIDAQLLRRLKKSAVIPLMWETWEYRPEDLDLAEARRLQIPVLGTNESHPDLRIMDYLGPVVLRLLLESQIEVFRSRLIVVGTGPFAERISAWMARNDARVVVVDELGADCLPAMEGVDALVFAEHHRRTALVGGVGQASPVQIASVNPSLTVVHVAGSVDRREFENAGLRCVPERFADPGFMSVATDYAGPRALIDLHTAGLKVGELMSRLRPRFTTALETELAVLSASDLAQGFPGIHPA